MIMRRFKKAVLASLCLSILAGVVAVAVVKTHAQGTDPSGSAADKRWLAKEAEFCDVLRGEFGLNMTDEEIHRCVAVMKNKGTGDTPHPFFA